MLPERMSRILSLAGASSGRCPVGVRRCSLNVLARSDVMRAAGLTSNPRLVFSFLRPGDDRRCSDFAQL